MAFNILYEISFGGGTPFKLSNKEETERRMVYEYDNGFIISLYSYNGLNNSVNLVFSYNKDTDTVVTKKFSLENIRNTFATLEQAIKDYYNSVLDDEFKGDGLKIEFQASEGGGKAGYTEDDYYEMEQILWKDHARAYGYDDFQEFLREVPRGEYDLIEKEIQDELDKISKEGNRFKKRDQREKLYNAFFKSVGGEKIDKYSYSVPHDALKN